MRRDGETDHDRMALAALEAGLFPEQPEPTTWERVVWCWPYLASAVVTAVVILILRHAP